jgi:hypothetical protein
MDDVLQEGWQAELPEDLRADETLSGVKTLSGMAKMLVHAQSMVGADKVVIPNADSSDEDKSAFYNKLGRPEKADGYDLKPPEGLKYEDAELDEFKTVAHKIGLTDTQTNALFEWHGGLSVKNAEAGSLKEKEALQTSELALKKDWGNAYDQNFALAMRAVKTFANEDSVEALERGLGNDPSMVKMMHKIGASISEEKLKGNTPVYTPTENKDAINTIMGDLKHPYHDKKHPGHDAAVQQVQKLYTALYPQE